jgi:ferredoxin
MNLHAEVDENLCLSSGKCVADAPSAFEFDPDEIARPIDGARALDREALLAVARNCPSGAIRILDGDAELPVD